MIFAVAGSLLAPLDEACLTRRKPPLPPPF